MENTDNFENSMMEKMVEEISDDLRVVKIKASFINLTQVFQIICKIF